MTSAVDICNLALSFLGDSATVASIDPPEGSPQAGHCARFYPIALDSLLSHHTWSFTLRRAALARLADAYPAWDYAYARPIDARKVLHVYGPDPDALTAPAPFEMATLSTGQVIIVTDQEAAECQYVLNDVAAQWFTPDFVLALAYGLAAMLAGPLLRGKDSVAMSEAMLKMAALYEARAAADDANQGPPADPHRPVWITAR